LLGTLAEQAVADFLLRQGYTIIGRNVRVGQLEVDILARHGDAVAVVEVRTRGGRSWQSALDSVGATKRERLRRAAQVLWNRRFCRMPGIERMRFDVASVQFDASGEAKVEYIRAAF
jgi:putative endonuclease